VGIAGQAGEHPFVLGARLGDGRCIGRRWNLVALLRVERCENNLGASRVIRPVVAGAGGLGGLGSLRS